MSTDIISENDGYDFSVTRFYGGNERGKCYQINVGPSYVVLSAWQMMQLFSTMLRMTRNGEDI